MNLKYLTKASLIAAIYIILVLIQVLPVPFASLTFGPIQLRLAEGLTLLPLVETAAIPGTLCRLLVSKLDFSTILRIWISRHFGGLSYLSCCLFYIEDEK